MKVQRTVPPAAAPIGLIDLLYGTAGLLSGRKYMRELEKQLKRYFDVKHVFLVSSGKAALTIILQALKALSPERRKVLIPAYTCFSVPSAIVKAGLTVSACDLGPGSFDFDYALLKKDLDEEILCIVSTHLFGIPVDTARLNNICKRRGIFVVEDAAQAMGGESKGRKLGTLGDVGFFSLGRGKNITCGSGGIIVTNERRIADAIQRQYAALEIPAPAEEIKELILLFFMKVFLHPVLYWLPAGLPSLKLGRTIFYSNFPVKQLSGMKAGILQRWQSRLIKANQNRQKTCALLAKEQRKNTLGHDTPACIRFPVLAKDRKHRDEIYVRGKAKGISLMYPTPVNEIPEIREQFLGREYPQAKDIAERLITVPTHGLVKKRDRVKILQVAIGQNASATANYELRATS